jgi:peptide methionine sulfoxide reductase msrA/msrB
MLPENPNKKLQFNKEDLKQIHVAGGCFWGVDAYLALTPGVYSTESGYANGFDPGPVTYEEVCKGTTGHSEAVLVTYDTTKLTLSELLKVFFSIIDPTTLNRQAGDIGTQYRTGIYYTNEEDKEIATEVLTAEQKNHQKPIVTEILPLENY